MNVLVTGAGGWTAAAIIDALRKNDHGIIAFDLSQDARPAETTFVAGDVSDCDAVERAVQSADAVVHLAVADTYDAPDRPFAVNVKGTYHIFEAARKQGIERVVLMSSACVHLEGTDAIDAETDWRSAPDGDHLYDLTKRLQEEIARDFCQTHAMNCITLRAGHIVDSRRGVDPKERPLDTLAYCRGGWVCRYDLARAVVRALAIDATGYRAYHVVGARAGRERFGSDRTERDLGFQFSTDFAEYS